MNEPELIHSVLPDKKFLSIDISISEILIQSGSIGLLSSESTREAQTRKKDPDGEIENSGKSIFEIQISNFCYIQVIVFDFGYLPVAAVGTGR